MPFHKSLPYRPCAGIAVFNRAASSSSAAAPADRNNRRHACLADAARRHRPGRGHLRAALRELYEETNIRSVEKLGEIPDWLTYDIPPEIAGRPGKGKYRGQTQKWYALRFTGEESEINIAEPGGGGHKPEFVAWRWERAARRLPELVVPFKRPVYERVVAEFTHSRNSPSFAATSLLADLTCR